MTVIDDTPRTVYVPRTHRRHEIVTTGGMDGVLNVGAALATCGFPVRDFAVDVREGVPYSTVTCIVSLTGGELDTFSRHLESEPSVIAITPC